MNLGLCQYFGHKNSNFYIGIATINVNKMKMVSTSYFNIIYTKKI